ncbi:MAG: metalloregulator ArsR/SmtB family transcription factor [Oligoflexia bacterium]|nr:metalloregulator ArsR/SmtB family transcription factor [Oligoflexia bacterium]
MKPAVTKAILKKCDSVSRLLKSLSHPVRLKVLCSLMEKERGVNELTEFCGISQSAMSQFLARMKAEGLLESRRERNHVYYRVADQKVSRLLSAIREIYC